MEAAIPQKLLVVDDINANNLLIQRYLIFDGVTVDAALSGEEALDLISKNHYCLFILDVMMQGMDGFDLAVKIREDENHKFTPIIFLTAVYSDEQDVFKGYESGAIDYLIKPVPREILTQKVSVFLELDKQKSELRFQADLLQNVNDSIIYTDLEGVIKYVNQGTEYTFGYKPADLLKKTLSVLFPEQHKDLTISELLVVIDFRPYEGVWEGTHKNGHLIWLDVKINLMRSSDGKPTGYIVVSQDISDREKTDEEIIRSLITGEDNERKRIASDLHDGLGQTLTASFFNMNSLKSEIRSLTPEKQNQFSSGLSFLNEAIEETRNIAYNLMPKSIENYGIIPSIKSLLNSVEKETDFTISLSENIKKQRLSPLLEINIYRITQEILNNAIKHSNAERVHFSYQLHDKEFIFTYEDNGVGFNIDKVKADQKGEGLSNIKNRVTSVSGYLSITSKVGIGTSISIEIKL